MMRSLYSGVAGLKTHQTKMDVIGNNIANVNTTSFKSQSITFSDLMYQTTQTASGATETKGGVNARQIGLGAKSGAINTAITSQGATQTTNNPFDIMITGESFFIVNNGNENLYTRDGSFYVDGAGNLAMQSNGYFVQGWVAQEDKETGEITINKNGGLSSLQIMSAANSTYSPASTTAALYSGNIDDHDKNLISDDGKTVTLEFYDNKGYLYTGKFTLKDTGYDHQFALTLTDIIDSDGKSIGPDLLKEITFGNVESPTRSQSFDKGTKYSIVLDASGENIAINAEGGDVKYKQVPLNGYLSDLMSTSSKSYSGILNTVYNVTDTDEKNYPADATYKIDDQTGELTIKFNKVDLAAADGWYATAKYTYKTNSSEKYFVDPATLEAYHIPDSTANSSASAFADTDFLSKVFGISDLYGSADYDYTYYNATTPPKMEIKRHVSVPQATSTNPGAYNKIATVGQYYTLDGTTTGKTVLQAAQDWVDAAPAGETRSLDQVFYSFNSADDNITLYVKNYEDVTKTETTGGSAVQADVNNLTTAFTDGSIDVSTGIETQDITDVLDYIDNQINTLTSDNEAQEEIKTQKQQAIEAADLIINDPNSDPTDVTQAEADKAAAQADYDAADAKITANNTEIAKYNSAKKAAEEIQSAMTAKSLSVVTDVKETSITGTTGLMFSYEAQELGGAQALRDGTGAVITYSHQIEAEGELDTTKFTDTQPVQPKGVYVGASTFAKAYGLTSLTATITSGNNPYETLLGDAFGTNTNIPSLASGQEYTITFSNNTDTLGYVSIAHSVTETAKGMSTGYSVSDNGDGTLNYTSETAYESVPVKGNIADLLTTAEGDNKGLLNKVYGITDEQADAYGIDGTYEINTSTGAINLTVGKHSVQLKFDAANGSLVSADTSDAGLVTMNFNQSIPGLEAFGYQQTAGDTTHNPGDVQFDFSTVTNYNTNGSSTIKAVKGDKKSLNTGRAVGEMNGVSISTDGQIYATYSNGQTKLLGQIASAEFANASGLSKEGDNLYASTLNSGEATIQDITTDGGYMNTGVLEMSNVDLSSQFTEMITTQRGFQANSRIITVSDTLLEELTNLKR
ncbi:flagellar hook-basal body complex protein [Butyrivibrio hungatei]|uniref:Flagellar hook protein FlgE n=1 Tax=Butyrivibrio hungatei TaxID=185008 RepID=A0A1D9P1I6_9FIRM|nr:flagellar hook-basal body complex protein [Butyrivibrio hungatei]AOZ96468.1 flagellar basal-body rod protein [Butyrivibrio hungatei]